MSTAALAGVDRAAHTVLAEAERELQALITAAGLDEAALARALAGARELGRQSAASEHTLAELSGPPLEDARRAFHDALRRARLERVPPRGATAVAPAAPLAPRSTDPVAAALARAAQGVVPVRSGEAGAAGFDLSDASAAVGVPHPTVEGIPEEVFADTGEFRGVADLTAAPRPAASEPPTPTLVDALDEDTDLNGFELDETIEPDGFDDLSPAPRTSSPAAAAAPGPSAREARSLDEVLQRGRAPTGPQRPPGPTLATAGAGRAASAVPTPRAPTPPPTRTKSGLLRRIFGKEPKDD